MAKRKRKKVNLRKLNPKRLLICAIFLGIVALGLKTVHYFGDEDTRDSIESGIVSVIDIVRESRLAPDEMVFLLDEIAYRLPFVRGVCVDVGELEATELVLGGVPETSVYDLEFLQNAGYIVGYDNEAGNPAWVAYKIFNPKNFETKERPAFDTDRRTRSRISPADYTNSGFDRGHMAPNQAMAVCYGERGQRESFLMSNIVPQCHELNAGLWKDLEQRILKRYSRAFGTIWVLCGPLYNQSLESTRKIGKKIAVPDAFFLVVVDRDEERNNALRTLAFIIPHSKNSDDDARNYIVPIREVERRSRLNFFPKLDEFTQNELELPAAKTIW